MAGLLGAGLLAGCGSIRLPRPAVPVSVISFGGGFNLPLWAARDQGFFARHGIAPSLNITVDSKQVFSGLMVGRYQIAITAFDNIVGYQEGQGELRFDPPSDFFAFMGSDDGFLSLVATPEVRSFADLKGKTVSVDAMSNGFSFALREMLARNGLAESDVLATARDVIGPDLGIVGAARRSWARANEATVVDFIGAYRDAVRWLKAPDNRAAAEALLVANVPGMTPQVARQSAELMLHPQTGFFSDVQMEPQSVQAVLALRSKLGEPRRVLDDPARYVDRRYWQRAMAR